MYPVRDCGISAREGYPEFGRHDRAACGRRAGRPRRPDSAGSIAEWIHRSEYRWEVPESDAWNFVTVEPVNHPAGEVVSACVSKLEWRGLNKRWAGRPGHHNAVRDQPSILKSQPAAVIS